MFAYSLLLSELELIIHVFGPKADVEPPAPKPQEKEHDPFNIDYVPPSIPSSSYLWKHRAKIVILEDNDAVIDMCMKQRSPMMRHALRVHRVDLDSLWELLSSDPRISMRYVGTKQQMADILTKGSFTKSTWDELCGLIQIGRG